MATWGVVRPGLLGIALVGMPALLAGCGEQTTEERLEVIEERADDAKQDIAGQADAAQRVIDRNAEMTKEAVRRYDDQADEARAAAEAAQAAAEEARHAAAQAEAAAQRALTAAGQTAPASATPAPQAEAVEAETKP